MGTVAEEVAESPEEYAERMNRLKQQTAAAERGEDIIDMSPKAEVASQAQPTALIDLL